MLISQKKNCIAIIKPLLIALGDKYEPNRIIDYIPSVYLRKCLKNGRE